MPDPITNSPDYKSEVPTDSVPADSLNRDLHKERHELQMAVYVLNEEVMDMLTNPDQIFVLNTQLGPVYKEDIRHRQMGGIDPDFNADIVIRKEDGTQYNVRDAYSMRTSYLMVEPRTGKSFDIVHQIYNSAYFPFNYGSRELTKSLKAAEITRHGEFTQKEGGSAFDFKERTKAVKEEILIRFDGYEYIFQKIANSNGPETVELEIANIGVVSERTCLRKSNSLSKFDAQTFDNLRRLVEKAVSKSRRRGGNS
jgi:hypothetical protein